MSERVSKASIISSKNLNSRVMELQIDLGENSLAYKPGQIIALSPMVEEQPSNAWSYYSIASGPNGHNGFDLCVNIEGFKKNWPTDLDVNVLNGQKVSIKGPLGAFILPDQIDKDLVFLATGTGVAPFRSMLQYIIRENIPHRSIHLIYGGRYEDEVLYRDEFEQIESRLPSFRYDIVLSRDERWTGCKGRLRDLYLKAYSDKRDDVLFYLCGWPDMVRDGLKDLSDRLGYSTDQLIYESYN